MALRATDSKKIEKARGAVGSGEARDRFAEAAKSLFFRLEAPGMTAAVVFSDGSSFRTAVGVADAELGTPMRVESRMPGGSTGKSVYAATAISLALEGKIGLDDPVSRWLGEEPWFRRIPNSSKMTIRALLTHSSGMPDHMGDPNTFEFFNEMRGIYGSGYSVPPLEAVGRVFDKPPVIPVNGGFFYSDTGYILMGLALESATGRPLYEEAKRRVLDPLRLSDFEPAVCRQFADLAPGYASGSGDEFVPRKTVGPDGRMRLSPASEWAGGGFVTGVLSLAQFVRLYAGGHAFEKPYLRDLQRIVRFSWQPGRVSGYGLGLFAMSTVLGPAWGHGGYYPGYRSDMLYFPDHDIAVAYQVNSSVNITNYPKIVEARAVAANTAIPQDTPLSIVTEPSVELAAAALGVALPSVAKA